MSAPSRRTLLAAGSGLAAAAASFYAGFRIGHTPQPRLNRLTFRRGTVNSARFAPDGRTIFYSASWEGAPSQIFAKSELATPPAVLASISRQGELAVILSGSSNLARVSPGGGTPHEVVRNVIWADWAPDGANFLIVRVSGSRQRIELPIGKVLYETENQVPLARLAPDGRRIAFFEILPDSAVNLNLLDSGRTRTLISRWRDPAGLAFPTGGNDIWFSASHDDNPPAIHAVDLSGKIRPVLELTEGAVVCDISPAGRVLFTAHDRRAAMIGLEPGQTAERDLSWFDRSMAAAISADGSTILFAEAGKPFVRKSNGSPPAPLDSGAPLALSPDAQWAALLRSTLVLVPLAGGEPREL